MNTKWQAWAILAVFIAAGSYIFWDSFSPAFLGVSGSLSKLEEFVDETKKAADRVVHNPPPLRFEGDNEESLLTVNGVIDETNARRKQEGLDILVLSSRLNSVAQVKVDDMFARQYFAHEAPDGKLAADLAEEQGYEYISIGENLALGNFQDDEMLVDGWMNSPGHRENILRENYEEIGVAVKKAEYQGNEVWMAVQIFGRPLSSCPAPNKALKIQIDANNAELEGYEERLQELQAELDQTPKKDERYNQIVTEYNNLVDVHNQLLDETKVLIRRYNETVNAFNACVEAR